MIIKMGWESILVYVKNKRDRVGNCLDTWSTVGFDKYMRASLGRRWFQIVYENRSELT